MANLLQTIDNKQFIIGNAELPIDCFRCGICCERYQPAIHPTEISAIATYLGISEDKFMEKYVQKVPIKERFLIRRTEKGCAFLSLNNNMAECTIYEVRPSACRDWQASLARSECQEGLKRFGLGNTLLTPYSLYLSKEAVSRLIEATTKYK